MKKFNKLIGISFEEFQSLIKPVDVRTEAQIQLRPARLIPTIKVGDEMALTSIFLSAIRLVKEFRNFIFKEINFPRSGKNYYYTEVCFPGKFKGRIDGMIVNVLSGKIKDVVFFEMKTKDTLDKEQINNYIKLAKDIKVDNLVTISNQFVSSVRETPIKDLKVNSKFNLFHYSWTYILTIAHILLFDNDDNIDDVDQIEIMNEVVKYFEDPKSGIQNLSSMSAEWKVVCEKIFKNEKILSSDENLKSAVISWHQKERDLALLLSRTLGAQIKSSKKSKDSLKTDISRLLKNHNLKGSIMINNTVSNLDINLDFIRRTISMTVVVVPPSDKTNRGKVSFLYKQLEKCEKKEGELYQKISDDVLIEPDFKFLKNQPNFSLNNLINEDFRNYNDIKKFKIHYSKNIKNNFSSRNKFVAELDQMTLMFYEGIVQHLTNWKKPPPKVDNFS